MQFNWKAALCGALVLSSVLFLAACQKKADVPYSATLDRGALMLLPFPAWKSTDKGKVVDVDLSALDEPGKSKAEAKGLTSAEVTPIYVVRLDEQHAVMLTQTMPVDERNEPQNCHACAGIIGAYFFEHAEEGWRLSARQDAVANSGREGNLGKTDITKLGDGHFALTSEWGSCWQGYCGTWLVVVGLEPGKATTLSSGIPLSAENDGAYGACSALDDAQKAKAAGKSTAESEDLHECFDVDSKWKFDGKRLLVTFRGRLSELDDNGKLRPTQTIAQQAVYAIEAGEMKLLDGTNPVPHF